MPDAFVVIISQETLQAFTRPGLDLQTGQIIELYPVEEPAPVQLELFGTDDYSSSRLRRPCSSLEPI